MYHKLKKYIEEFINGNIQNPEFQYFNQYSVKASLSIENENKQYVYNEMSFQHELGEYLRRRLNENQSEPRFMVQFERNINTFGIEFSSEIRKHEIDISIVDLKKDEYYLIELKYHKEERSRYPNTMFDCVKDIDFVHEAVHTKGSKFKKGYCVTIVEDTTFYHPKQSKYGDNLYANYWCFRNIEDGKDPYLVKKAEGEEKTKPIDIKEYVNKYHYLPIREKVNNTKEETQWKKIFDENEIKNIENKKAINARYYIIEVNQEK